MKKKEDKFRILFVPNEDGFGPSALGFYILKALLQSELSCQIVIWNKSRFSYNQTLCKQYINQGNVIVEPIWNIIQLQKVDGFISIPQTLHTIGDYRSMSDNYPSSSSFSLDFDLIVDIGVPSAARWAVKNDIRSISVFDHCWSKTLEMIFEDFVSSGRSPVSIGEQKSWERLVEEIRQDEMMTQSIFLFPQYITPKTYYDYWKEEIKTEVLHLPGVLGGQSSLSQIEVQRLLGLKEADGTILIQGGDTPVWDNMLKKLVPALSKEDRHALKKRNLNVLVYVPQRLTSESPFKDIDNSTMERVRIFSAALPGGTLQNILSLVDLIVTRAGGGTVNDAVACRTPFVSIRETGHSQVEAILDECVDRGLTRPIDPKDIERAPLRTILEQYDMRTENKNIAQRMLKIALGAEEIIVRAIIDCCIRGNKL